MGLVEPVENRFINTVVAQLTHIGVEDVAVQ